jgi:hypothetical protein
MSSSHMQDMIEACGVVATTLDVAADVIVGMKEEAIAQLLVMATTFVADQAAAIATLGIAEAAEAAIVAAAKEVVKYLENQLAQHIMGEVIGKAVEPLKDVVERTVESDASKAADIKKILADMDENATKTVANDAERDAQADTNAVLHKKLASILDPAGEVKTGPVTFRPPKAGGTAEEIEQMKQYTAGCNKALEEWGALTDRPRLHRR